MYPDQRRRARSSKVTKRIKNKKVETQTLSNLSSHFSKIFLRFECLYPRVLVMRDDPEHLKKRVIALGAKFKQCS